MSLSWYVVAIRPPDEKFLAMKKIWDACHEAGVEVPASVRSFFNGEEPDDEGVLVEIRRHPSVTVYSDSCSEGFQVELAKLPPNIKFLRFYVSS